MILSQTARYALRATVYLADGDRDESVRVEAIAEELDIPRNYLSKILHGLARSGILNSTRGPRGGFKLALPAEEVRLMDVVSEFDSVEAFGACLLGRPACGDGDPCAAHEGWGVVRAGVEGFLKETTLAQLSGSNPPV